MADRSERSEEAATFVTHLECSLTGSRYPSDKLANLSEAGKPLIVRYDLERLSRALAKRDLLDRPPDMWRYREFLPIRRSENVVSLGECITPLVAAPRAASKLGGDEILVKEVACTGLIGMSKAFDELESDGSARSDRAWSLCNPRPARPLCALCSLGAPWEGGSTSVPGMRVPFTIGNFLILRVLRKSRGFAVAVPVSAVEPARGEMGATEGIHLCSEGAATYAAYKMALADGRVAKTDRVVLFNCATGLKYPMSAVERRLDRDKFIDFANLQ